MAIGSVDGAGQIKNRTGSKESSVPPGVTAPSIILHYRRSAKPA